jgi:hypothetical protein
MAHSHTPSISARETDLVLPAGELEVAAAAVRPRPPSARQRILYIVNQTPSFAGIERVVDSVAQELSTRFSDRFDVTVLYLTAYEQIVDADRAYRILLRTDRERWKLLRNVRAVIAEGRYDLVVVAQVEPTTLFWARDCRARAQHGDASARQSAPRPAIAQGTRHVSRSCRHSSCDGSRRCSETSPRQLEIFKAGLSQHSAACMARQPGPQLRGSPGAIANRRRARQLRQRRPLRLSEGAGTS